MPLILETVDSPDAEPAAQAVRPFRAAVLSGLGGLLAPLLTVVILLWVWQTLKYYVLAPVTEVTRDVVAAQLADIRDDVPANATVDPHDPDIFTIDGVEYQRLISGKLIPYEVYTTASASFPEGGTSKGAIELYRRWVELEYLRSWIVIPVFLLLFFVLMYMVGTFFAAGVGRFFWSLMEAT
ncbi:MAG: hypothetical protein SGJ20_16780, partial [Planctomycetota bacterium]|nr:hypothetical protein [Planctomycetota bacterium]